MKKCEYCGRKIDGAPTKRYCNDNCRQKAYYYRPFKGQVKQITCGVCGHKFTVKGKGRRYCSKECGAKANRLFWNEELQKQCSVRTGNPPLDLETGTEEWKALGYRERKNNFYKLNNTFVEVLNGY